MFKDNNKDTRTTPRTPLASFWCLNFEHVLHLVLVFLLSTLNMQLSLSHNNVNLFHATVSFCTPLEASENLFCHQKFEVGNSNTNCKSMWQWVIRMVLSLLLFQCEPSELAQQIFTCSNSNLHLVFLLFTLSRYLFVGSERKTAK